MTLGRLFAFTALISLGFAASAQAQTGGSFSSNNAYQFGGMPGSFGYNNTGSTTVFDAGFRNTGGLNLLGCGGIGAFNFMNTTFNMNNIIDQLKQNMQTMLAKQLLIQAMSIPQVSAIFDTLNAFGNARFSLFNQSCNLNQIKKEARQKIIDSCIATHGGDKAKPADVQTCQQDFDKDSNIGKFVATAFKNICGFENFNQAIRPTACRDANGNATSSCAFMAFIPQVRLNLSGGVGGNSGSAMCQTNSNYYGTRSAALPLQSVSDIMRSVSDIFIGKAQSQIDAYRTSGLTYAQLKAALAKLEALCAAKDPKCTNAAKSTADLTNPASPGFVRLAKIDYQQTSFADSTSGNSDATIDYFKKTHGITDTTTPNCDLDPLCHAKALDNIIREDNPSLNLPSLDLTDNDVKNFTNSVKISADGDAGSAAQLSGDAQSAANLMQIAATYSLAKEAKIDLNLFADQEYIKGPNCAMALRNGLGAHASHLANMEVFGTSKGMASKLQQENNSKQIKPTGSDGKPITDTGNNDTLMGDTTQKTYNSTIQATVLRSLDDSIAAENRAYLGMQDWARQAASRDDCRITTANADSDMSDIGF